MPNRKAAQSIDKACLYLAAEINETYGVGCASVKHDEFGLCVNWYADGAPIFERFMGYPVVVIYMGGTGPAGGTEEVRHS